MLAPINLSWLLVYMIQNLFIDSVNKSYGTSSNFQITLDDSLNINNVKLLNARIPVTWYNIDSLNNTILFNEGAGNLTATLPLGNYNITDLTSELKIQLDSAGLDTYTVTYDSKTMKMTISSSGTFSLLFNTSSSEIWEILGFNKTDTNIASSHVGNNVIDLIRIKYIQIIVPELGIIGHSTKTNQQYTFLIPVNENRSDIIHYFDNNDFNQIKHQKCKRLSFLNVQLKDQKNREVNLNGSEISMIVEVESQSKK